MDISRLSTRLDAAIEEHDFSGVIRISHAGEAIYECAAGYADRANRIPNTMETRFGIASGTKLFTALAIGKLIGSGKITLDARLKDIIDLGFPLYSEDITIQHLLTHTSGIPDYYDEEKVSDFDGFTVAVPWSELRGPRDYLAVFPDQPMKFTPGERFSYSNGGFITLGIVIEEISGRRYRDFVESEIFERAGMSRSGSFAMNKLPGNTAFGYVEEDDGWRTNIYDLPIIGASDGGAFTTVGDMTKLWDAFWAYEILPEKIVNIFTKSHSEVGTEGKNIHYGHGIWIYDDGRGVREEYVEGCDAGVSFRSGRNRGSDLEVTVISNTTSGVWPILREIDAVTRAG
ncbi:MAG: beta-lactamase family protein [Anaerolineae bacterium]|nr:beta-lactamase family protein [Anaerolineae bacterium]